MASSINQEKAPTTNSNLLGQERDKSETTLPWFYKCFFSIGFWKAGCTWAVVKSSNRWRTFVLLSQKKVRYYLNVFEFLFLRTLDSCWNLKSSFWLKKLKWSMLKYFVPGILWLVSADSAFWNAHQSLGQMPGEPKIISKSTSEQI